VTGRNSPAPEEALRTLRLDDDAKLRQEVVKAVKSATRPVLVVLSGSEVGKRKSVEGNILVGRDPAADLPLTEAGVSWQHARIEDRGDCWAVVDLGSTNGTSINGNILKDEHLLQPNDKLVFGTTVVRFEIQDAADQAYDELVTRLMNIDDLSGLLLRRKFDTELAVLIERARAETQPVGMLVMDLDGVKKINDTHGHLFGAYVIGEAGRVIGSVLGGRGIAARFGGDEYIAAILGANVEATRAIGEEMLAAVRAHAFVRENVTLTPGISIGVASFPENAEDHTTLFQRADEALYRAKQAGKGRVSL
jgi:diguanylate cyclase (GGDEF)-like protein